MTPLADNVAHLSVNRAFVVQLQSDPGVEQGHLAGWVEHMVSGRAADFQSLEMLLAFITQVVHEEYNRSTDNRA